MYLWVKDRKCCVEKLYSHYWETHPFGGYSNYYFLFPGYLHCDSEKNTSWIKELKGYSSYAFIQSIFKPGKRVKFFFPALLSLCMYLINLFYLFSFPWFNCLLAISLGCLEVTWSSALELELIIFPLQTCSSFCSSLHSENVCWINLYTSATVSGPLLMHTFIKGEMFWLAK